ncbi:Ecdysteroid UDP-glucosyltransferase [Papilio machaon]|uniref:UDP-glucuronosyltransferase n=1 Tax=Papilio machaon TaxID=76193 RepID=A0A0N1PKL8_PAPMA|nr:Ecdysteroid UDP-glucosyltransferase [Papilio machaon]
MGSVLKSAALPESTKRELLRVLGSLPYTVLWKFEEQLEGLPKNVHIRSWMPQASILAHPNVKVFITHGGLLSTLEALKYGVPLLAIPVFGDQPGNAIRAMRSGYARKVTFSPDMAPELERELKHMLADDT